MRPNRVTDDGATLLQRLRPGVRMLQEATRLTRGKADRPVLRVAAPQALNGWIISRLSGFRSLQPEARIEFLSSGRRRSASADVNIAPLTAISQRAGAQPLVAVQIAPVCSPAFLEANPVATPADLLNLPLIDMIPNLRGWSQWFLAADVKGEIPPPALSLDNHALLPQAVLGGCGVGVGMRSLVADYLASGQMVEPFPIYCDFAPPLGILINEGGNVRAARAFAQWVIDQLGEAAEILSTIVAKN